MTEYKRAVSFILALVVMMTMGFSVQETFATAPGVYTIAVSPHYKHPVTGKIEDSGDNEAMGQGMTQSATHNRGLLEVDSNGNHFATVRMKLMDNITRVSFSVDGRGVSASKVKANNAAHTADFRFRVPSASSVIRCSAYVAPMERSVVYFITMSNPVSGHGDFTPKISTASTKSNKASAPVKAKPKASSKHKSKAEKKKDEKKAKKKNAKDKKSKKTDKKTVKKDKKKKSKNVKEKEENSQDQSVDSAKKTDVEKTEAKKSKAPIIVGLGIISIALIGFVVYRKRRG